MVETEKLFRLLFVQITEEIIKGSVNLDVDIDGDVDRFDFHGLDLDLMSGTG
jgi:hypothetical protein